MHHHIQLLSRQHCHLCAQVAQQLMQYGIQFQLVDIDQDDALRAQYNSVIPVLLCHECDAELLYPFSDDALLNFLQTLSADCDKNE